MYDNLFAIYNSQDQDISENNEYGYFEIFKSLKKCEEYIKNENLGTEFKPIEVKLIIKNHK